MIILHFGFTILTGLFSVVMTSAWLISREKMKSPAGSRAWVCIDLPSPDTPRTLPARGRDWLRNKRLSTAPAALAVAALALTAVVGVSAWVC
jgi:hypothetical protein